jgi:UDP-2-acetamido-3-amino-2,3-dideoxy-glucuronate N-acetyltransferase
MRKPLFIAHATAIIEPGAQIGQATRIWHHAHVRAGARIGLACSLGKNVYVDAGAIVGDRCKIQNNCSIYDGVILGDHIFVGPHVTFTNDKYPRADDEWVRVATHVGDHASFGAHATVVCGVTIGEYAMIGAGAVVTTNVDPYALMIGNPARQLGVVCRRGHRMIRTPFGYRCPPCGASLTISRTYKEGA